MEKHEYQCPVAATMDIIGGRWKPIIIWVLLNGTKRFGQLHAIIGDISMPNNVFNPTCSCSEPLMLPSNSND